MKYNFKHTGFMKKKSYLNINNFKNVDFIFNQEEYDNYQIKMK